MFCDVSALRFQFELNDLFHLEQECISVEMRIDHGSGHLGVGGLYHTPLNTTPIPLYTTPAPVDRMTHACENVTFPASLCYAVGKNARSENRSLLSGV